MKTIILDQKYGFVLEFCTVLVPDRIEKQDSLSTTDCSRLIIITVNEKFVMFIGLDEFSNYVKISHNYEMIFQEENSNLYTLLNEAIKFLQTSRLV